MKKVIRRRLASEMSEEGCGFSNTSEILKKIYLARGARSDSEFDYSLQKLERPSALKGFSAAVKLLVEALQKNQKICIVGDFDADGATSTALCVRCLKAFGHDKVEYIVPNRFEYGYGLSEEIVAVVAKGRPDLLVTVDNGISSIAGVAAAKAEGIKVLVTDHHLAGAELPQADAIVNPNQPDCEFISKSLAGVGVIFYVMSGLRSALRSQGWFAAKGIAEPSMAEVLDIVALGTVADVVPLEHNNRILVKQGLKRIQAGLCVPGIRALLEISGRDLARVTTSDLGFAVGPRLNAAGRLDDMSLGIRCLLSDSPREAYDIARELDDLNKDRKSIEQGMQQEAFSELNQLSIKESEIPMGLCLYKHDWHQGVIGILASRVKDKYHRPTIVFAEAEPGMLKGSGRSISGIHLRDVLDEVATSNPNLLTKFGGHAMAAGLSLKTEDFARFQKAFNLAIQNGANQEVFEPVIWSDGEIPEAKMILDTAYELRNGGPWGQHFPEPAFDGVFRIVQQRLVGEKHLKLVLAAKEYSNFVVDGIAFNCDLDVWPDNNIQYVLALYKLDVNEFRGEESLQLLIDYIEPISEQQFRERCSA